VAAVGLGRSQAVREKLSDVMRSDGSIRSVYLHRRRTMSDDQLATFGVRARVLGLTADFLPPESIEQVPTDELDVIASVSRLESRYYQGNMLLRDSDANGMAHSLEIRVPFLDRRLLEVVYRLPGSVRVPAGLPPKHLLRRAFADVLRPELVSQKKRGFTLPIRRWMRGELRDICEASLARLRSSGLIAADGVDRIWQMFLANPESPIWSRAWSLVVLGRYLDRLRAA
jgi:asparagine synthase (glutamine-hydrolysing)